jgi:error-prone DNA polymerase
MPELPHPPVRTPSKSEPRTALPKPEPAGYAELYARSNFSFLQAASHPDEFADQAAALGYDALAVTDVNSLAGVVRAYVAAKEAGLKQLVGAEVTPDDAPAVVLLAIDRDGYANLSRLITVGRRRARKGECRLSFADVAAHSAGLIACVPLWPHIVTTEDMEEALPRLRDYRDAFGDRAYALAGLFLGPEDGLALARMGDLAKQAGLPLVATNAPLMHHAERRFLLAVLTCVRLGKSIHELGDELPANGERHLKSGGDMRRLFKDRPDAIRHTLEVAGRCSFQLDALRYEYPEELVPTGLTPAEHLARLAWEGAAGRYPNDRYPNGVPEKVKTLLGHELGLIERLGYEPYFLTVHDLMSYARSEGILCQGRGSAANSVVCYCLGITEVDPMRHELLFERFVSAARNEPPDIDIDFEADRRELVLQYAYRKYGRDRCGMTAEVITYRPRSAIRDVGKALGLSRDRLDKLASGVERYGLGEDVGARLAEAGLDPASRLGRQLIHLTDELLGFPRHLGQHVGGLVLSRDRLDEMVPVENARMNDRTVIQWNKDDLDALGLLKVDCLGLGMLQALRRCFGLVKDHHGRELTVATIPPEDPAVYRMIRQADTVGVFQVESRAQMAMSPRMKAAKFYDLVIQVALVRPGPIQGDMVHPYLRRRDGLEEPDYPNDAIKDVLGRTLGVPIFQEQCMKLVEVAAGFTPDEADALRRAMGAWRRTGTLDAFRVKLHDGMLANGYEPEYAARLFEQIRGFSEYGFPESHAASFALLVYASAWLKLHHPAAFCCALLNSQPMGFYAPAQLVDAAKRHGVGIRPVDVNASEWDCTLEPSRCLGGFAVRLGLRMVRSLHANHAERLVESRKADGLFLSVADLAGRARLPKTALAPLAAAGAFRSLKLARRPATWDALAAGESAPLYAGDLPEAPPRLPDLSPVEEVAADYRTTGLSLQGHPMEFSRTTLDRRGVTPCGKLGEVRDGAFVTVAGLVLLRQRPGSAKDITFMTLEDETGQANLVVYPAVWDRFRRAARTSSALIVSGRVQRDTAGTTHLVAGRLVDFSSEVGVTVPARDFQ